MIIFFGFSRKINFSKSEAEHACERKKKIFFYFSQVCSAWKIILFPTKFFSLTEKKNKILWKIKFYKKKITKYFFFYKKITFFWMTKKSIFIDFSEKHDFGQKSKKVKKWLFWPPPENGHFWSFPTIQKFGIFDQKHKKYYVLFWFCKLFLKVLRFIRSYTACNDLNAPVQGKNYIPANFWKKKIFLFISHKNIFKIHKKCIL